MSEVIRWKTRDPLYGFDAAGLKTRLKELLAGRVEEVWMFGSIVAGACRPDREIDMIMVRDNDVAFTQWQALFDDVYELLPALDLLVYTPK